MACGLFTSERYFYNTVGKGTLHKKVVLLQVVGIRTLLPKYRDRSFSELSGEQSCFLSRAVHSPPLRCLWQLFQRVMWELTVPLQGLIPNCAFLKMCAPSQAGGFARG
jgi:hypothetical protein